MAPPMAAPVLLMCLLLGPACCQLASGGPSVSAASKLPPASWQHGLRETRDYPLQSRMFYKVQSEPNGYFGSEVNPARRPAAAPPALPPPFNVYSAALARASATMDRPGAAAPTAVGSRSNANVNGNGYGYGYGYAGYQRTCVPCYPPPVCFPPCPPPPPPCPPGCPPPCHPEDPNCPECPPGCKPCCQPPPPCPSGCEPCCKWPPPPCCL